MKPTSDIDRKLAARLLAGRRVEGDRLMLSDTVLGAALDGSRVLTPNERRALEASPLTVRRLRQLALERRNAGVGAVAWLGSAGMLRAAASGAPLGRLATDDGHWSLHFVEQGGAWRVILALAPDAPFAARLMREQPWLRVLDGGGAILLQGQLDSDGECESAWPFDAAPAFHLQQAGARFAVEPVHS